MKFSLVLLASIVILACYKTTSVESLPPRGKRGEVEDKPPNKGMYPRFAEEMVAAVRGKRGGTCSKNHHCPAPGYCKDGKCYNGHFPG